MEFTEEIEKIVQGEVNRRLDRAIADLPVKVFDYHTDKEMNIISEERTDGEMWLWIEKGDE